VLDKMKKIFNMAKEGKMSKTKVIKEAQRDSEITEEKEIIAEVQATDDVKQTEVSDNEIDQMKNPSNYDEDYLEYSPEAIGFANREEQWNTYRTVMGFIPEGESILDFGCARGDFERFCKTEYNESIDYVGVDMNKQLIDAGLKVYNNEVDIRCVDWFKLKNDLKKDWFINIGSCDLRYDANLKLDDNEYMESTLKKMYHHANKGIVAIFASDQAKMKEDGLINRNAGNILNWAQKEFGTVALDHTVSNDVFVLIIYKN
jgi:SAM-dependent methyltransferase